MCCDIIGELPRNTDGFFNIASNVMDKLEPTHFYSVTIDLLSDDW